MGLGTGVFIENADSSIVFATYSTISSEFDSLDDASWLVVTYGLAMCAIQPTVRCTCAITIRHRLKKHIAETHIGSMVN